MTHGPQILSPVLSPRVIMDLVSMTEVTGKRYAQA